MKIGQQRFSRITGQGSARNAADGGLLLSPPGINVADALRLVEAKVRLALKSNGELKRMKIFISHAAADKDLATKFVDLLQLGVGAFHDDLFYSSAKGTIPNGEFFVQHIIAAINSSELVIALLSKSYFSSHFCLAEAGAALARKATGNCGFFSLVVPPATFSDLDGMLHGVQSGSINERPALAEMKDRIQAKMTTKVPGSHVWDQKRDEFLNVANDFVSSYQHKEALTKLSIVEYKWQRDDSPHITVHSKLRITLRNLTGGAVHIEEGQWTSGGTGIPTFWDNPQTLKWRMRHNDEEKLNLVVPAGADFRTWIGLADSVSGDECLKRSGARQTGTMHLKLKIGNHSFDHPILF